MILNRWIHMARQATARLFSSSRSSHGNLDVRLLIVITDTQRLTTVVGPSSRNCLFGPHFVVNPDDTEKSESGFIGEDWRPVLEWDSEKRAAFIEHLLDVAKDMPGLFRIEPITDNSKIPKSNGIKIYLDGRREAIPPVSEPVGALLKTEKSRFSKVVDTVIRKMRGSKRNVVESAIEIGEEGEPIASSSGDPTIESKEPIGGSVDEAAGVEDEANQKAKDEKDDEIVVNDEKKA